MAKSPKRKERGSINGAFAWRLVEMIESPAYRVLSLSAHRVLARLEIELADHGGKPEENGKLPCTYGHFVEFGLHPDAIAPAIRELAALGFVEITRKGCAGNAGYRQPTLYRLTYRHCGSHKETTDEWRRIKTMQEAETIAKRARAPQSGRVPKTKVHPRKPWAVPPPETMGEKEQFPPMETMCTSPPPETMSTSISCRGPSLISSDNPTPQPNAKKSARKPEGRSDDLTVGMAPSPGPTEPRRPADEGEDDAPHVAMRPKLTWRTPVVRELIGAEAVMRRAEIALEQQQ